MPSPTMSLRSRWGNRFWMTWNTLLAIVPAVLAVIVFRPRVRLGPLRLSGAALCLLFLPNARLRRHRPRPPARGCAAHRQQGGRLPRRAAPLHGVRGGRLRLLRDRRRGGGPLAAPQRPRPAGPTGRARSARAVRGRGPPRPGDAAQQLGHVHRPPTRPSERALATLSWDGTPRALLVLFLVIWSGHDGHPGPGRHRLVGGAAVPPGPPLRLTGPTGRSAVVAYGLAP